MRDPNENNVVAYFSFDDDFISSSNVNIWPSIYGPPVIDKTVSKFGGGSLRLSKNSVSYLKLGKLDSLNFRGDFTIEFWLRPSGQSGPWSGIIKDNSTSTNNDYTYIMFANAINSHGVAWDRRIAVTTKNNTGLDRIVSTTQLNYDQWYHIAVSKNSAGIRLFIDGTIEKDYYSNATVTPTTRAWQFNRNDGTLIGNTLFDSSDYGCLDGWIDDLTVTNGVARYLSNFTPPTEPYEYAKTVPVYIEIENTSESFVDIPTMYVFLEIPVKHFHGIFSGNYSFEGKINSVTVEGLPARKRVFAFHRKSMIIAGDSWSDSEGTWKIKNLDETQDYLLMAVDDTKTYEPIAYDWVKPKEMTDV